MIHISDIVSVNYFIIINSSSNLHFVGKARELQGNRTGVGRNFLN